MQTNTNTVNANPCDDIQVTFHVSKEAVLALKRVNELLPIRRAARMAGTDLAPEANKEINMNLLVYLKDIFYNKKNTEYISEKLADLNNSDTTGNHW